MRTPSGWGSGSAAAAAAAAAGADDIRLFICFRNCPDNLPSSAISNKLNVQQLEHLLCAAAAGYNSKLAASL
jgi:hypothetical protein